jgi:hypothetical protein
MRSPTKRRFLTACSVRSDGMEIYDLTIVDPAMVETYLPREKAGCASAMRRADPRTYINASSPPMFLLHGTADTTAPHKK